MTYLSGAADEVRGWAGYLLDVFAFARAEIKNPRSMTKFRFLNRIRLRTGARTFIETGTYKGITTARAARVFDRVITIELDEGLAASAKVELKRFGNVSCLCGDAGKLLPQVVADSRNRDMLVFLDGHYSGPGTALGDEPEPALKELGVLAQFGDRIRAIVVDDFRTFGTDPGVPQKSALLRAAEELFPGAELLVDRDQLAILLRSAR